MELQFITHCTDKYSYRDSAQMALEGGCRWIQLRMKEASPPEVEQEALRVKEMCDRYGAVLIIDDHVEIARRVNAHGVHVGKNDMPVAEARKLLGGDFIIGATANTFEDVRAHRDAGADYVGCGPFRFTSTKKNLSPILGLEGYRSIVERMRKDGVDLPLVAIGGIERDDIPELMAVGVSGIALSGTVLRAENPVEEMKSILETIRRK